jgi:hypothetical protein
VSLPGHWMSKRTQGSKIGLESSPKTTGDTPRDTGQSPASSESRGCRWGRHGERQSLWRSEGGATAELEVINVENNPVCEFTPSPNCVGVSVS